MGVRRPVRTADNLATSMCRLLRNLGSLNPLEPKAFFFLPLPFRNLTCLYDRTVHRGQHWQANFLTKCVPDSDSVVILCGKATARPFVSKDALRAGNSISQRDHSSSLLTDCILVENEKMANSHSKKRKSGNNDSIKSRNNKISTAGSSGSRNTLRNTSF